MNKIENVYHETQKVVETAGIITGKNEKEKKDDPTFKNWANSWINILVLKYETVKKDQCLCFILFVKAWVAVLS